MRIGATLSITYCSCFVFMTGFNLIVGGLIPPLWLFLAPGVATSFFLITALSQDDQPVPEPMPAAPRHLGPLPQREAANS
jgi:hypothetical protein